MATKWIEFVKQYASKHGCSYKEAMAKAKSEYKTGAKEPTKGTGINEKLKSLLSNLDINGKGMPHELKPQGGGLSDKLEKHFKGDEIELKKISKVLKTHTKNEKKIEGGAIKKGHYVSVKDIMGGSLHHTKSAPMGEWGSGLKSKVIDSDSDSDSDSEQDESIGGQGITPVARMGGKSKLAERLIKWFPPFNTYCELFLGAGNVFLRIPQEELVGKKIVLNDLDKDMYTIFAGLKKDPKGINEKVRRKWLTKEEFMKIKTKTDASSLITKYKNSFYGMGKSHNVKNTMLGEGRADGFTTNYEKIGDKLKNATITNTSFEKLIPKYDSPTTFFYLDPPYENPKQTDYKDYVTPDSVFKALQGIKGKFMLSYNDSPNIRSIFSKYHIKAVETEYAGHKGVERRKKMEVIITNYKI